MNNKRQNKQPLFAEVNLTGDEFEICQCISRAKRHTLDGNQCAMGRAATLQRLFETAMTDFTEQLHKFYYRHDGDCIYTMNMAK